MPTESTSLYDQAYAEYMHHAQDPAWRLAFEIYLGETFQEMATYHQGQIQAIADKAMLGELNQMRRAITKHYLAARVVEIQKSTKKRRKTEQEGRWEKEGYWTRKGGRFASYHGPKAPSVEDPRTSWSRGVDDPKEFLRLAQHHAPASSRDYQARALGANIHHAVELNQTNKLDHAKEVWERTAQMHNDLFERTNDPRDKQRVQYVIQSPDGSKRIEIPKAGDLPEVNYRGGERVHMMTPVGPDNPPHVGGKAINIGLIAGMSPDQAAKVGGVTEGIHQVLGQTNWGKKMQATAGVLAALSGGSPLAVQAHAFAQMVNLVGPQASRAFGGKLRQLTYRYTGQEAHPDEYSQVAKDGRQRDSKGELEPTRAFEMKLVADLVDRQQVLPTKTQYAQSLQSGSTPPSKGYILDRNGKVVSEAVGHSDDWYTPFNLKKLPDLRGGSYVRTRGYGGLTPEDIRLAMRTGATRATVVSNNGVFTMEFNPRALHWGHRWGFAGAAMVRRYTKSLDAIKNDKVPNPDAGPDHVLSLNAQGYQSAMQDLRMKYPYWVVNPQEGEGVEYRAEDGRTMKGFHQSLAHLGLGGSRVGGERQGDPSDDQGYVSPLNSRAKGAMYGWHEKDAETHSLWDNPLTGKHAYNTIDRYQLQHDSLLNVHRIARQVGTAPSTSGSATSGGTSTAAVRVVPGTRPAPPTAASSGGFAGLRAVQGAGQAVRSYGNGEHVDRIEVDKMLDEARRVMVRGAVEHGILPEEDSSHEDFLKLANVMLTKDFSTTDPNYIEVRNKLANSAQARESFVTELGDIYGGGKVSGGNEMLAGWEGLTPMRDEGLEGAAAAADEADDDEGLEYKKYAPHNPLPLKQVLASPAVSQWRTTQAGGGEKRAFAEWEKWMTAGERPPAGTWEDRAFKETNRQLADILTKENRHKALQEKDPVRDDGTQLSDSEVSEVVTSKAPRNHREQATAELKDLAQDDNGNPVSLRRREREIRERAAWYLTQGRALKAQNSPGGQWHESVGNEMLARLESAKRFGDTDLDQAADRMKHDIDNDNG